MIVLWWNIGRLIWWWRRWYRLTAYLDPLTCEYCGKGGLMNVVPGMTAYHYEGPEGVPGDPNRDLFLCRTCEAEHIEHWDEMWTEYRASQGR